MIEDRPSQRPDRASLSVVLPNYNHALFLPRALDALLAQSRPPDEIIIVDDASTDGSRAILDGYIARAPGLRLLLNDRNLGALRTLQRGLDASEGDFVYFGAADDYVLSGFFERALNGLAERPEAALYCAETPIVDAATGRKLGVRPAVRPKLGGGYLPPDEVAALLRRADNFIHTGSSVFRRDAVFAAGGFDPALGSFADGIMARKAALANGFVFEPRDGAVWLVDRSGLSRSTALDARSALDALDRIPAMIAGDPGFPDWYAPLFARRWRFAAARLALEGAEPARAVLRAMAGETALDRTLLAIMEPLLGIRLGRTALLTWLTLRLRPYRLRDLAATALARRRERSLAG